MATATFSLTELQFRNDFFERIPAVSEELGLSSADKTDVDHLNALIKLAFATPGSEGINDDALRLICAEAVNRFTPNKALGAVSSVRTDAREKGRAAREAKKDAAADANERMGSTRLDGSKDAANAVQTSAPEADTTKSLLRSCTAGVRWIPEGDAWERVPHPATAVAAAAAVPTVPVDDAVTAAVRTNSVPAGTAWQRNVSNGKESTERNKKPPTATNSPTRRAISTPGTDLPTAMDEEASQVAASHPMVEDLFASVMTEQRELVNTSAAEHNTTEFVTTATEEGVKALEGRGPPTPTPWQPIQDELEGEGPPEQRPIKTVDDVEMKDNPGEQQAAVSVLEPPRTARKDGEEEEGENDTLKLDDEVILPPTQPVVLEAKKKKQEEEKEEENASGGSNADKEEGASNPLSGDKTSEDPSEETPSDEAYILLLLTAGFGLVKPDNRADEMYSVIHTIVWTAVEKVIEKLETIVNETGEFDYSRQPPVSNFYLERRNVGWLLECLVAIGFLKASEGLTALNEIEATGYPTTLLASHRRLTPKKQKDNILKIARLAETYLANRPWESKSSNVHKQSRNEAGFEVPKSALDFVPTSWIRRYCTEEGIKEGLKREREIEVLRRLNVIRTSLGLPQRNSLEEAASDAHDQSRIKDIEGELDDEEDKDDDYDQEEEDDDDDDDDSDENEEEVDLTKPEEPREKRALVKMITETDVPKPRMKPSAVVTKKRQDADASASNGLSFGGASRRKSSKPKRIAPDVGELSNAVEKEDPIEEIENSPRTKELLGTDSFAAEANNNKKVKATREPSPLPAMDPKLEFVALTACPSYNEIRAEAQNGKAKTAKQLNKRVMEAQEEKKKKTAKSATKDSPSSTTSQSSSSSSSSSSNSRKSFGHKADENGLTALLECIRAPLPKKLQPGLTFETLAEALAALGRGETIKNASCKRAIDDAQEATEFLLRILTSHLIHRGNLGHKIHELVSRPEEITASPLPTNVTMPRICQITGTVYERRKDMWDIRIGNNDTLRVCNTSKQLLESLNHLINLKSRVSASAVNSKSAAETFIRCYRFIIKQLPASDQLFVLV